MGNFLQTSIVSGDNIPPQSPAQIPCLIGAAPLPAVGSVFTFNPGDQVTNVLGFGLLADCVLYVLRNTAGAVNAAISDASGGGWSAAPSVTHLDKTGGSSPTGPTVTTALASGAPGCLDDHNLVLICTGGGALGTATFTLAYDGGPAVEQFVSPVQGSAFLTGSQPITPTTLGLFYAGAALTLVFVAPSVGTVTWNAAGSRAAAGAGLKTATATIAAPTTYHASDLLAAGIAEILAYPRALRFTSAGATPSHVPATIVITGTDYTGATQTETVVPATTLNGTVTSTKVYASVASLVLSTAGGTDATIAYGYEDTYATVAEFLAETNTLLTAIPEAVSAYGAQQSDGTHLGLVTTAVSTSATLTLNNSPGTSAADLGFANGATATGTNATRTLPASGLVLTFATGTYVAKESYLATCTGPRSSVAQRTAASLAARNAYNTNPFGFFADSMPTDLPATSAALEGAYDTQRLAWLNDANAPRDLYFLVAGPWHVASATAATNATNIGTHDAFMLSTPWTVAPESIIVDDVYLLGSTNTVSGKFRRVAAIAAACMRARAPRVAATMSEGNIPEASLTAGDGLTKARDQNTAVQDLSGMAGPGFFCLQTASDGVSATFALGANKAGASSRLRSDGDFAVACETARLAQSVVLGWKAQRPETDITTGAMTDAEKSLRHDAVDAVIGPFLRPAQGLPNCSGYDIAILDPPTGRFTDNGITPTKITIYELGTIQQVVLVIGLAGTTITVAQA
jgi:hypothetical protein